MGLRFRNSVPVAIAMLLAPLPAFSDIHKCNGQWTNLPCDGVVEREISEIGAPQEGDKAQGKPDGRISSGKAEGEKGGGVQAPLGLTPAPTPQEPLAPRYEVLRKLRRYNDELKRAKKVTVPGTDIEAIQKFCLDRKNTFSDCSARADSARSAAEQKNKSEF